MSKQDYINSIREEYSDLDDMPRQTISSSVRILADDLYAKDSHFIFELIQNAEDNSYTDKIEAQLRFEIGQFEIDGQKQTSMIVHNNEIGFNEQNVRAICMVGHSTKKKVNGYIGEKGIGFKSVFRITNCPYIFSNGFQFRLPEHDEETGLGYIVPSWVSEAPQEISPVETSIVLPLKNNKKDMDGVVTALRDIAPETILFLKKLKKLAITISLPGSANTYNLELEKKVIKTIANSQLIELTCKKHETDKEDISEVYTFWLTEFEFKKPDNIQHEKRAGIESRVVTVAIPLDGKVSKGKLFAYLPVWEDTGIPFLINADFLLVSSREGIHENEDWNIWLRDCVVNTYTSSLLALLNTPKIPFKAKVTGYASIPLVTHYTFLEPIIENISNELSVSKCVLVLPDKSLVKPSEAKHCYHNFRELLKDVETLPNHFIKTVRIICPEMEAYSGLKSIGVGSFTPSDIISCISDTKWLKAHELKWFVKLFNYLRTQKNLLPADLQQSKIVPVKLKKGFRLTCDNEQPMYFPLNADDKAALQDVPEWLSELVPIAELYTEFDALLNKQQDSAEIKKWMQEVLMIYGFSKDNFCTDIVSKLSTNYIQLNTDQLVKATKWLSDNCANSLEWDDFPIILSDGSKMLISEAHKLTLVIPERYYKDGWQNIWTKIEERRHFLILNGAYSVMSEQWFLSIGANRFPGFESINYACYQTPESISEAQLMKECKQYVAISRFGSISVSSYKLPSSLSNIQNDPDAHKLLTESLFALLLTFPIPEEQNYTYKSTMHKFGFYALGTYENRGSHYRYAPSSVLEQLQQLKWLPTTKGYAKPSQAFQQKNSTKEILGDTVPYFEGTLPANICTFLGIRSEVTVVEMVGLLRENSGTLTTNQELTARVYQELYNRTEHSLGNIGEIFLNEPLIYVSNSHHDKKWFTSAECVWEDASEILGNDFAYLKKAYPTMGTFFVIRLGIKEKIDSECFANRWLKLQEAPLDDTKKQRELLERLYREIKPIALTPEDERPDWWDAFYSQARIYSQSDKFCETADIIFPDDKFFQNMFKNSEDVEFVWYPEDGSFSEWTSFFRTFDVALLTTSVTEKLDNTIVPEISKKNRYVTESAIKMIASWLKENRKSEYESLLKDGRFNQLMLLSEACVADEISIEFCLETEDWNYESQHGVYPAFWDSAKHILYYKNKVSKSRLAQVLAKPLTRYYKDLANWIELVLGADSLERIYEYNWNVPREINDMYREYKSPLLPEKEPLEEDETTSTEAPLASESEVDSLDEEQETSSVDEDESNSEEPVEEKPQSPPTVRATSTTAPAPIINNKPDEPKPLDVQDEDIIEPEGKVSVISGAPTFDYNESLKAAFTQKGLTQFNDEVSNLINNGDEGILSNPSRRADKLAAECLENINKEPTAEARRKETERSLLEPPNEAVRSSLYDWYQGKCQICGDTWPKKDGNPYFAAAYIVERQNKRWLDEPGNSLCLCAKHFAQWRLATKLVHTEITEQIGKLKLQSEGGDGDLSIYFQLVDQEVVINLCERHALALRGLVEVVNNQKTTINTPQVVNLISNHDLSIGARDLPISLPSVISSAQKCPYCQVSVSIYKLDTHMREKCPKRPARKTTQYAPSNPPKTNQYQANPGNNNQATFIQSQPVKVVNGRIRCRFCSGFAMSGSDVCYSCG